jgi:hypothetical protein
VGSALYSADGDLGPTVAVLRSAARAGADTAIERT